MACVSDIEVSLNFMCIYYFILILFVRDLYCKLNMLRKETFIMTSGPNDSARKTFVPHVERILCIFLMFTLMFKGYLKFQRMKVQVLHNNKQAIKYVFAFS